jgi:hypothetical protein
VNESKTKKQRYWVTFFWEKLPIGTVFEPGKLHLTVIPWFVTDVTEQEVIKSFNFVFSGLESVELEVGKQVNFGPKKNVPAHLVKGTEKLIEIHKLALDWFEQIEGRWAVKNPYVGDEYKPHIRRRDGAKLQQGEILHLDSLALVKANRQEDNIRVMATAVNLL